RLIAGDSSDTDDSDDICDISTVLHLQFLQHLQNLPQFRRIAPSESPLKPSAIDSVYAKSAISESTTQQRYPVRVKGQKEFPLPASPLKSGMTYLTIGANMN